MSKLPQISEAEFEVMKIIWKYAPINTNEITERLLKKTFSGSMEMEEQELSPMLSRLSPGNRPVCNS